MDKILNLDSVDLYNKLYGLETLNPLVSVIDLYLQLVITQ